MTESSGDLWLTSSQTKALEDLETETRGIRFIRQMKIGLKPTTYGLQLLDQKITGNTVEVDREELRKLLEGELVETEEREKGYVALKYRNRVIGCGFYKDGTVSSRIPKGRAKELLEIII